MTANGDSVVELAARPDAAAALAALSAAAAARAQTGELVATDALRVCADPANLPLPNERGEGYENRVAALLGRHAGMSRVYRASKRLVRRLGRRPLSPT